MYVMSSTDIVTRTSRVGNYKLSKYGDPNGSEISRCEDRQTHVQFIDTRDRVDKTNCEGYQPRVSFINVRVTFTDQTRVCKLRVDY